MRILIRTEIGGQYGLGHGIRMRALARALESRGAQVCFITTSPALQELGAPFLCLNADDAGWNQGMHYAEYFVYDTKVPTEDSWYSFQRFVGRQVVRIDHPQATPDTCDLLIGPCQHWSPETVARLRQDLGDRFLYGWDCVMLDEEVTSQAPIPYEQRHSGPIVFCAGGSDPTQALEQLVAWTQDLLPHIEKRYLVGRQSTGTSVEQLHDAQWVYTGEHAWLTPFARTHLREAALVVSLFGTTPYECLWYRTPALVLSRSPDEAEDGRLLTLASHGAAQYVGALGEPDMATTTPEALCHTIQHTWDIARQRMHAASAGLLDGRGVERVADAILQLGG